LVVERRNIARKVRRYLPQPAKAVKRLRLWKIASGSASELHADGPDHRAINLDRPMVWNFRGRAVRRKTGDSTFSPGALNHRAINLDRPMVWNFRGRAGTRKTGDSTFSPGAPALCDALSAISQSRRAAVDWRRRR
jgi:hypothetical protein